MTAAAAATDSPIDRVLRALADQGPKPAGDAKWKARCPAHEDQKASLSIGIGDGGRALINCFAGCAPKDVVAAAGLDLADLMPPKEQRRPPKIAATYDYTDEEGGPLYQVVRYDPKNFRPRRRLPSGWVNNLGGVRRVLYNLPGLLAAPKDAILFVVEGERDVETMRKLGLVATTNAGGCGGVGQWSDRTFCQPMRSRNVVVIADADAPGRKHAAAVTKELQEIAADVRILELPGPGKDASDWIGAGGTAEKLLELVKAIGQSAAVPGPELVAMSTIAAEPIAWRWEGRLEAGEVATLEGLPSAGKSTVGTEIAAAVSTGRALYGDRPRKPESVIWISHEESRAKTLRPRLDAAGADVSRVFVCNGNLLPSFPDNYPWLTQQIRRVGAGVVFIDPIDSYLDFGRNGDSNRNSDVRARLVELSGVAQETGATIILVRHWRKQGGVHALYRSTGSIAYTAVARAVINVVRDPDDEGKRIVSWAKMNNAPEPSSLAFSIGEGRRVAWLGEDERSAQEVMDQTDDHEKTREPSALEKAKDWLRAQLAGGRMPSAELKTRSDAAGISEMTMKRARQALDVHTARDGRTRTWYSELPASKAVSHPPTRTDDLLGPLDPLTPEQEGQGDQGAQETNLRGPDPLASEDGQADLEVLP